MPNIKPFNALLPAVHLQEKVVTRPLENYSTGEAKLIASENDCSFLHLINPELDNPYLKGTRQELVFKKIKENLSVFLEKQVLIPCQEPSIFIYRVEHDGLTQTGVWTITHIEDYLQGNIKVHEHTVERRERLLADYLQHTRLDANPVLIIYEEDIRIEQLISRYTATKKPILDFRFADHSHHQVWQISTTADLNKMVAVFKNFSSVYMNTKEVKVLEFNRLVRDLGALTANELLEEVKLLFDVEVKREVVKPIALHEIGMYLSQQWYVLKPKQGLYNQADPVAVLDVSILQNAVLDPLLGIRDPRTDARITFSGGKVGAQELQKQVDNGLFAVAFTLFPVAIDQLIAVADAGGVMPPKSTWVEPKFLVGLITNYLS